MLLPVTLTVAADAPEGDAAGYVVLTQGARTRRIPYWAHVERPRFATATARLLRPGIVRGSTRGQPDRVQRYRYPAYTGALGLPVRWRGGEVLYRFRLEPARDQRRRDGRAARRRRRCGRSCCAGSTRIASRASPACRSTSARR